MESFKELDIHQAKELIEKENPVIVDIRDPDSFNEARIKNAVSLNDSNIQEFVNTTDKTKPILCYCYHGLSSQQACGYLKDQGFETVYSVKGGFDAWKKHIGVS